MLTAPLRGGCIVAHLQVSELGLGQAVLVFQGHTATMARARRLDPVCLATIYNNYFCRCFFPYYYLFLD